LRYYRGLGLYSLAPNKKVAAYPDYKQLNHTVCRYVVLITGKKALHEALVERKTDFADRPDFLTHIMANSGEQDKG